MAIPPASTDTATAVLADARPASHRRGAPRSRSARASLALAAACATIAVLSACSAIPPQSVTNPLGLDGQQVTVSFPAAVAIQAVQGEGAGTFTFDDFTESLPLKPGLLTNTVALDTTARLSGPAGIDTITLTDPVLTVRLWHGAATYDDAAGDARAEVTLQATATIVYADPSCFAGVCDYKYQSGPRTLGDLSLSGSNLATVLDILTQAPTPNGGSVSLTVQGDPDELAGRTLRFTLDAEEGELRF